MKVAKLFAASASTSATSVTINLMDSDQDDEFIVQATLSSTGTIAIQGRISADFAWSTIASVTASGLYVYARVPELQAVISANGGTITIGVGY